VRVETDDAVLWLAVADVNHYSTQPRRLWPRVACTLSKTTWRYSVYIYYMRWTDFKYSRTLSFCVFTFVTFVTFRLRRRLREVYCGHARLSVSDCLCVCACLSVRGPCPHYCTDPDVTWGVVGDAH